MAYKIEPPFYPIVYVRGYAMTAAERTDVFHDAYYGFSATSVERREAPPPKFHEVDIFEGQFIRLMKMQKCAYADAVNSGLQDFHDNPCRSIWISRYYDQDHLTEKIRRIETHAEDLRQLVCETIPRRLKECGVDLGPGDKEYKVILIAHSMGGLVCRTLIQNLLPAAQQDPCRWIHRLVTIGTPHGGIDLGAIPDILEAVVAETLNPFDSATFSEKRMRDYLKLPAAYDVHSLGDAFPASRCFCVIGSDHTSYSLVRSVTGGFSDGLVRQDRAYIVTGKRPRGKKGAPAPDYPREQCAYWANVHRAHSGRRGIVNSYEAFENIRRFLFGDAAVDIFLDEMEFPPAQGGGVDSFFDLEFLFSVRGTGVYLHRREQDPCENAIRVDRSGAASRQHLHTVFMNSGLRLYNQQHSHFAATLRVIERRTRNGWLWDREYPARPIYNEAIEIRIGDLDPADPEVEVQYRWLSDGDEWRDAAVDPASSEHRIPLREASAFKGVLVATASPWPARYDD